MRIILAGAFVWAAASCASGGSADDYWASPDSWYQTGDAIVPEYADVIYFVSTNILESKDAEGNSSARVVLNEEEKATLSLEIAHMRNKVYKDSLNYFAPFYHEMTMESFYFPPEQLLPALNDTFDECLDAFNYYWTHFNDGRPFILAGFSQGAMMVKHILKNMTDEQYRQMVAAYVIGFELTEEDIKDPHIVPAQSAYDKGVTISFNSVCDVDDVWTMVCSEPAACINPVNWCTDATPAPLQVGDISLSVAMDPTDNVVVVTGYGDNPPPPFVPGIWPDGCLHGQEIIIYAPTLSRNALDRAY